jgi:hypothetical protein
MKVIFFLTLNSGATWAHAYHSQWGAQFLDVIMTPSGCIYTDDYFSKDTGLTWNKALFLNSNGSMFLSNHKYIYNPIDKFVYSASGDIGIIKIKDGTDNYIPSKLGTAGMPYRPSVSLSIDTTLGYIFATVNDTLYLGRDSLFKPINNIYCVDTQLLHALDTQGDTLIGGTPLRFLKSIDRGKTWKEIIYYSSANPKVFESSPILKGFMLFGQWESDPGFSTDGCETVRFTSAAERSNAGFKFDPKF